MTYITKYITIALTSVNILSSHGAILSYNIFDGDTVWTPSGSVSSTSTSGNDLLYAITSTGDLDGLGISDDTISFVVRQSHIDAAGDPVAVTDTANRLGGLALPKGDTYSFSIESISYVRGENYQNETTFLGFDGINIIGDQGGVIHTGTAGELGGAQSSWSGTHATVISFNGGDITGTASVTNALDSAANSTGFRNLTFQIEVDSSTLPVPEPSSAVLVAIGTLGMLRRRR